MVDAIVVAAVAVAALLRTLVLRPFRGARPPGLSLRAELVRDVIRALVLHSRRAGIRWLRAATGVTGPPAAILQQASFEGAIVGGVAGDVCVPLDEPEPARTIVYFHGGGYVIGSVASYHETLARLALGARARVLGVEYRLAPEHLLPAAQDDCLAATRGVLGEHDPASVVLAGDSAGGALVAATLCALRDAGQPLPAAGVLICPWTDPLADGGSMQENATTDFATREVLVDWISKAVGPGGDARDPRFAPLHADLTGLPPLLVQVGGQELLLDQARAFAERAEKSGVATTLRVWERMFHVFQMQAGLLPEGAAAIDEICAFVQDRTGAGEIREPA